MGVPRIFVSSTFKDLELEREYVQIVCRELGFDVRYYPEQSPAGSQSGMYMKRLNECHVLIYMATSESKAVERELEAAGRLGIPVIELAKVDSSGAVTPTAMDRRSVSSRFQVPIKTLKEIRSSLTEALQDIIYTRFESGKRLVSFGKDAYQLATDATESATFRLGILQETPTLILGPEQDKYVEESSFAVALKKAFADINTKRRDLHLIYLFDGEKARRELQERPDAYPDFGDALQFIRENPALWSSPNVTVKAINGPLSASIVYDTSVEICTVLHDKRYYLWLEEVGGAANDLWIIQQKLSRQGTNLLEFIDSLPA